MNKITLKDIAKMLSLSVSTVSRALSDHDDISAETKERVKYVAEKFNYLPNLHARFFRKKNTRMIALILPEFNRFFIPDLIAGIQFVIDNQGYSLIIFQSRNNYSTEVEIIKYCMSWVVEGVLISLSDSTLQLDHLNILKDSQIPVVILDKIIETNQHSTVTIDDCAAAYLATQTIIKNGRKTLLGVFGHDNLSITRERKRGYMKALNEAGLPCKENNCLIVNQINQIQSLLIDKTKNNDYDGLFIMTDELLVHSLNHFLNLELSIPKELGIVSISDGTSPYFLHPNISHIFHSGYLIGKTACNLLFEMMADKDGDVKHKMVETNLIDLGSL